MTPLERAGLAVLHRLDPELAHGLSLRAEAGQLVALVGPSGAGKTTITSLVARLYDATSGAVRLGDHDVRDVTLESLHANVGVVTQVAHLFHDTIRANLDYARPGATQEQMVSALRDAQIWDLVQSLPEGLDTVVGDRGHRLSGGEKQRIALARVLLKDPRILILDEATSALDAESERIIQSNMRHIVQGRTVIIIAHRLNAVRRADRIIALDGGRIVEQGTHAELLTRPDGLYARLWRLQSDEE